MKRDTNWGITALYNIVATVLTACGIETILNFCGLIDFDDLLQQYLPLAVCDEGYEAAEEQSDDEVRTSLVPDRREGKTKVMKQQYLPLAVCDEGCEAAEERSDDEARTSLVPDRREGKTKVMK